MVMTNQREIEITQFVSGCMRMKGLRGSAPLPQGSTWAKAEVSFGVSVSQGPGAAVCNLHEDTAPLLAPLPV